MGVAIVVITVVGKVAAVVFDISLVLVLTTGVVVVVVDLIVVVVVVDFVSVDLVSVVSVVSSEPRQLTPVHGLEVLSCMQTGSLSLSAAPVR